jgi:DNA-binding transcriptional MerR regulator
MKPMDSRPGQGANRSDSSCYREDLQRSHGCEGAGSYASYLRDNTLVTGLARASLLNYESMGLLVPRLRSEAGYRLYGIEEQERALAIRRYRSAGLSLPAIKRLLQMPSGHQGQIPGASGLLKQRLFDLSDEIERLREQQRRLARLLSQPGLMDPAMPRSKLAWVRLLRDAGFSEADMAQWHAEFEAESPEAHGQFLQALGLSNSEVAAVRRDARAGFPGR